MTILSAEQEKFEEEWRKKVNKSVSNGGLAKRCEDNNEWYLDEDITKLFILTKISQLSDLINEKTN
mgnify:CR=1 FL=1